MVEFCETIFAQSELVVYKNFEKNYNTYRRTWGANAEGFETKSASTSATSRRAARAATVAAADKRKR